MALSSVERTALANAQVPNTRRTMAAVREYMSLADLTVNEMSERVGYSRAALAHFLRGVYERLAGTDKNLRASLWEFMNRNPLEPRAHARGRLFETENARRIRRHFLAAIERGQIALLYGPPGTQKTFALEHLVAERNRARKNDAIYVYASQDIAPLILLKRISREAGVRAGYGVRERLISNLLANFGARAKPPAIVVDEAQHLPIDSLEILRELHDRSECGLVLAGSHNLYEKFLRGRQQLEQWLSRIDHKDPLPGLQEDEVREIAARELGNGQPAKITEKQARALVDACRVDDVFARDANGKPAPCKYLSVRRLVKVLEKTKEAKERVA
jgi:hypothetical protein